jgi:hypothetical protein
MISYFNVYKNERPSPYTSDIYEICFQITDGDFQRMNVSLSGLLAIIEQLESTLFDLNKFYDKEKNNA